MSVDFRKYGDDLLDRVARQVHPNFDDEAFDRLTAVCRVYLTLEAYENIRAKEAELDQQRWRAVAYQRIATAAYARGHALVATGDDIDEFDGRNLIKTAERYYRFARLAMGIEEEDTA